MVKKVKLKVNTKLPDIPKVITCMAGAAKIEGN